MNDENGTYVVMPCENCRLQDLCKYKSDMSAVADQIIADPTINAIVSKVSLRCRKFRPSKSFLDDRREHSFG
jgi:hypothetical protein